MSSLRKLSKLTGLIHSHAALIENALDSSSIPQPSFAAGSPPMLSVPPELDDTRDELIEAIDELAALVLGPVGHLVKLAVSLPALNATLHAIYRFGIAQKIALGETVSYSTLADRCGLTEQDIQRFLRMAISLRLFEEAEKGKVKHNAPSAALIMIPFTNDFLGLVCEELAPASLKLTESLTKFPASEEPTESAAVFAYGGQGEDAFTIMAKDPERTQRFANGMSLATKLPSHSVSHFVDNCGWDMVACPRKIVDIGGSKGELCKALLEKYSSIEEAVSTDLPEVVAGAEAPMGLTGKLTFKSYSFSSEQSIRDADVYLFRNIFHNWSDKYAIRILRNQIPALQPGARIFVNEPCLPEPDPSSLVKYQIAWSSDLAMKMVYNAKDRSRDDWHALFAAADERFQVISIKIPAHSALAIIEVKWEG
ncbi:S-adenosyl-L-methionine-dependent methyltransferase [Xylariales sp. AK1849]|nr:S-adenosyl-L-methionine-dependent methyltransferase [Xylariales sp. AK1849]